MKYRYINPEVVVQKITSEILLRIKIPQPLEKIVVAGDFLVTFPDNTFQVLTEKELGAKFKPSISMEDKRKEMYRICTSIIDQEALIDEDNAELLLLEAIETARTPRKLI